MLQDDGVSPDVTVAAQQEEQADVDEGVDVDSAPPAPVKKTGVQVDEQLNKALEILEAKAA